MLSKGVALNVVMSIVGHRKIATTDVYNRLAGVGVKGSTNKLSYGLHFQAHSNNVVIPFIKKVHDTLRGLFFTNFNINLYKFSFL